MGQSALTLCANCWWEVVAVLTIAKLSRWSVDYYNRTAAAAGEGGGLGEYYSEHDTHTPVWVLAGDAELAAELVGLSAADRSRGADTEVVARWLDDGVAPGGAAGQPLGKRSVHGFDLTFAAPKSVSLIRGVLADDVTEKAILDAHNFAISEAMEYLKDHAGYTRVHNPTTGYKDLQRLPGLVAIAYQHETSRLGDPHLHTHVLLPNRQPRADGAMVSIDGMSLYHEAKAAGVLYQAVLRAALHRAVGAEWTAVDRHTGMAELAVVDRASIEAWSRRSTALQEWAAGNLEVVDPQKGLTAEQMHAAQKATRPRKPEELSWTQLRAQWREDARGVVLDWAAEEQARAARVAATEARLAASRSPF